jgi:hypothetical protein
MLIHEPCMITSRLLPGIKVGGGFISIEYSKRAGDEGRTRYQYHIDLPNGEEHTGDDLQSGCQGGSLQEGLASLLSFLSACGESYGYSLRTGREGENTDLFPANVAEWAYQNSDELSSLSCDFEETPDLIEE